MPVVVCDTTDWGGMRFAGMSDEEARHIRATMVPIRYAGGLMVPIVGKVEPEQIAVLQLDITQRPDLADLARVIHREGVQLRLSDPVTYLISDEPAMILSLPMSDPVKIDASVVIPWTTDRDFFFVLRESAVVYIVLGAIDELATKHRTPPQSYRIGPRAGSLASLATSGKVSWLSTAVLDRTTTCRYPAL
jgi:hypothetical protein